MRPTFLAILSVAVTFGAGVSFGQAVSPNADQVALRGLLVAGRFEELEKALTADIAAMHADIRNEDALAEANGAFEYPDANLRLDLDTWVAARGSARAYAARATYRLSMGLAARGEDAAANTSDARFDALHKWLKLALDDAYEALRRDSTTLTAYWVIQRAAWHVGDALVKREIVDRALRLAPASFVTRANYLHSLRPRWGGSFEEMKEFAEESQQYASTNPRLRALLGFIDYDEAETLAAEHEDSLALRKYSQALSYGEYWRFRIARARLLYFLDREGEAIRDCNAALAQRPQNSSALAWRALAYRSASDNFRKNLRAPYLARARADVERAVRLDPYQSETKYARKQLAGLLASPP